MLITKKLPNKIGLLFMFIFLITTSLQAKVVNSIGVQIGMESSETGNEKKPDTNLLQVSNGIGFGLSFESTFALSDPGYQSIYAEFNYFETPDWQRIHYQPVQAEPDNETELSIFQESKSSVMTLFLAYRVGFSVGTTHFSQVNQVGNIGYYEAIKGAAFWKFNIYGGPLFTYLTVPGPENVRAYLSGRGGGEIGYQLGPGCIYWSVFLQYNQINANEVAEGFSSGFYMRASISF